MFTYRTDGGMTHNTDLFPDPAEFRPERFMGPNKVEGSFADPLQLVFGFGRRYVSSLTGAYQLRNSSKRAVQDMPWPAPGGTFSISFGRDDTSNTYDLKGA
jgi:hypothetical protein